MSTSVDSNIQELIKQEVTAQMEEVKHHLPEDKATFIVFSGDFDKAMAAFIMATGAVGMGMDVTMFFTFWGCSTIKKGRKLSGKNIWHKMVNMMIPANAASLAPSQMSFFGIGRKFFNFLMKGNMSPLEELIELAEEAGVRFVVCAPSLEIMGLHKDEFIVPVEIGGVAAMYEHAMKSKAAYFI